MYLLKRILNIMAHLGGSKRKKKVEKEKSVEKEPIKVLCPEVLYMHLNKGAIRQVPDRIVLHAMSEYIEGLYAVDFLKNIGLSVHAIITPSGKIIRCRNDNEGAYHAKGFNTNSLGVEFLVKGQHSYTSFLKAIQTPYLSQEQYEAGMCLVKEWMKEWDITKVQEHSYLSPRRKFDPGPGFPKIQFSKDIDGFTKLNSGI